MSSRRFTDRLMAELDHGLYALWGDRPAQENRRDHGAEDASPGKLSNTAANRSAALMRVNLSGELAAQGLYRGQALTARREKTRNHMHRAAEEEAQHLNMCRKRVAELGGANSVLDPLWYSGSVLIGMAVGLAGERRSLGFVVETERQVECHLERHLEKLPAEDVTSRRLLEQMREDERAHGQEALEAGGTPVPEVGRALMAASSALMVWLAEKI